MSCFGSQERIYYHTSILPMAGFAEAAALANMRSRQITLRAQSRRPRSAQLSADNPEGYIALKTTRTLCFV